MSTQLAVVNASEEYSREKIELIKRTICAGATDDELQLFLYTAKRTGLDPLAKQIHMVKRWNSQAGREVAAIQTGIDGFRLIADRTGNLAGIGDVIYDDETGDRPGKATVTVSKIVNGMVRDFTASARWGEYVQTKKGGEPTSMWVKMPYLMLGKCAESLALRKAFPVDLSGVYTFEEMGQADNEPPQQGGAGPQHQAQGEAQRPSTSKPPVTQPQKASEVVKKEISGIIETAKPGGKGTMWLSIKGLGLMMVKAEHVDENMKDGYFIHADVTLSKNDKIGEYWALTQLRECSPPAGKEGGEVVEGEYEDAPTIDSAGTYEEQEPAQAVDPAVAQGLGDLFASGAIKKASDLPEGATKKPGTIGDKRAKFLKGAISKNYKVTGFTWEVFEGFKKRAGWEHTADMPVSFWESMLAYATGHSDGWKKEVATTGA